VLGFGPRRRLHQPTGFDIPYFNSQFCHCPLRPPGRGACDAWRRGGLLLTYWRRLPGVSARCAIPEPDGMTKSAPGHTARRAGVDPPLSDLDALGRHGSVRQSAFPLGQMNRLRPFTAMAYGVTKVEVPARATRTRNEYGDSCTCVSSTRHVSARICDIFHGSYYPDPVIAPGIRRGQRPWICPLEPARRTSCLTLRPSATRC
jgi:hypothetical protein